MHTKLKLLSLSSLLALSHYAQADWVDDAVAANNEQNRRDRHLKRRETRPRDGDARRYGCFAHGRKNRLGLRQ